VEKFAPTFLTLLLLATIARGGEEVRPSAQRETTVRREFKQLTIYPYIFVPVPYLERGAPVPMHFGPPAADCSHRDAPQLPPVKTATAQKPAAPADAHAEAAPAEPEPSDESKTAAASTPAPAYPPPANAPTQSSQPSLTRIPDEVLGYFKDPYIVAPHSHIFFDPIFEPAKMHTAPPSKATYEQK
jgi:hypothetical protein